MAARQSRVTRWSNAVSAAKSALEELVAVQEEYQEWYDNLPESLQGSATGQLLETIIELDIADAVNVVEEAESVDLPRGFGRD